MTQKFKVLVTRKWPSSVQEKLRQTFDVTLNQDDVPLGESELIRAMENFDAVLPTVTDPITDKIISSEKRKAKNEHETRKKTNQEHNPDTTTETKRENQNAQPQQRQEKQHRKNKEKTKKQTRTPNAPHENNNQSQRRHTEDTQTTQKLVFDFIVS